MVKRIWDLIRGVRPGVYVVQVDPKISQNRGDDESIAALAYHPGFVALTNRFHLQKAMLEARLRKDHMERVEEYYNLQNGIDWANFYSAQVDAAVFKKKEVAAVLPHFDDRAEFDRVFAQFTGV